MRTPPTAAPRLLFLVLIALLAGCSSKAAPGGPAAASADAEGGAEATADKGTINGTVMSDDQLPLPAARVNALGSDRYADTDFEGYYEIAGLLPGSYEVEVILGENHPVRQKAVVVAGETVTVDLVVTLTRPITEEPYSRITIVRGHMGCNVAGEACPGYPAANDKLSFPHSFEGRPSGFLYEMTWERLGPAPPPGYGEDSQPGWVHRWDLYARSNVQAYQVASPPYLRAHIPVKASVVPETPITVTVSSHPVGFLQNPGLAYEQDFTVYMTSFHLRDDGATSCAAPPEFCPE